jgi:hypothetical protein
MKAAGLVGAVLALIAGGAACSDSKAKADGGLPGDGSLEVPVGPGDGATSDGMTADAAPADANPSLMLSGRFGNLDPDLAPFDACMRTLNRSGSGITLVVAPQPLLAGIAGLEDGVPVDRVTRRFAIPFQDRAAGPSELFLVQPDTTDCTAPTGLVASDRVFGVFAQTNGERNTFAAFGLGFFTLVRERATCPAATACVHFWNFLTNASGNDAGPHLTFELVDGATRTVVLTDIAAGEDGPAVAPFKFDSATGTTEIPWANDSPLRLSVREVNAATPFIDVDIANAGGGLFTLWITGKQDGAGGAAEHAILCRDSDPDTGAFSPCTRVMP